MSVTTPLPRRRSRRAGPAFTLIELLVVLAVIALLAAILFPVFARAREQSRRAACLSNLKQIGAAFLLYAQDYDGGYPNTGDPYLWVGRRWRWPVMPYLGIGQKEGADANAASGNPAILRCPSDTLTPNTFDATSYAYAAAFYHTSAQIAAMRLGNLRMALNAPGAGAICTTQTEAAVETPPAKILVTEYLNAHDYTGASGMVGFWGTLAGPTTPGADRWSGGRVSVFADGHAAFVFARRHTPSADDCPDPNLTPGGLTGSDLR
jgi:prepilin-type N-terminal cleavage/methylation domain-containing protein